MRKQEGEKTRDPPRDPRPESPESPAATMAATRDERRRARTRTDPCTDQPYRLSGGQVVVTQKRDFKQPGSHGRRPSRVNNPGQPTRPHDASCIYKAKRT